MITRKRFFAFVMCLLCAAFLAGCAAPVAPPAASPADDVAVDDVAADDVTEIAKSPNDKREYRHLSLDNGLRVVLISDPAADKSAASLTVFRGSSDDPADRPGLAHFLEHMLFIGTEKYPEADGYFKFIQAHGGSANAYTSFDHTNYFFDIQPEFFREGLDRFAQFFISPLFDKEYVEREKNAVHSEYQLQIKDDGWRGFAVQKIMLNPEHPMSQFNIGSLDTLAGDVHSALLEFFENHYSADQMGLVVLTNETLDEMEPWVAETFAPIENRQAGPVERTQPIFAEGSLPATLRYQLLKDNRELTFIFPIPSQRRHYRSKPANYVSNLLGHEGEGSLHELLTEQGWITSLSAGHFDVDMNHSLMSVDLSLTADGAAAIPRITAHVFDYLDRLRAGGIDRWRYDEQAGVAETNFLFAEKSQPISAVNGISPALQHYPVEDLLVAPYVMERFDAEVISSLVERLTPENAVMVVAGPDIEGDQVEKWFGVKYEISRGPFPMAEESADELMLPEPNPFLPEDLDLLDAPDGNPQLVISGDAAEIYLDTDVEFGVPKAVIHISVRNGGGLVSLEDRVNSALYASLVQDNLNAIAYPALLAGVGYSISAPSRGFRLSVSGYADKQLVLLDEVLGRFVGLKIDPERFRVLKDEGERDLRNSLKDRPYQQASARLRSEIIDANWTPQDQLSALESLTPEKLGEWRDQTLSGTSIQALIVGNVDRQRAGELEKLLRKHLNVVDVDVGKAEVEVVAGVAEVDVAVDHDDAAMMLYVQNDGTSFRDRAVSGLLTHLIGAGYFASLRTDQQLGYVVAAFPVVYRERGGVGFIVQSPVSPPPVLKARTQAFLAGEMDRIAEMEDSELQENKQGLITKLTQRDNNLSERAARYWSNLDLDVTTFDINQQIADEVARLTRADMLQALEAVMGKLEGQYVMVYSDGKFAGEASEPDEDDIAF